MLQLPVDLYIGGSHKYAFASGYGSSAKSRSGSGRRPCWGRGQAGENEAQYVVDYRQGFPDMLVRELAIMDGTDGTCVSEGSVVFACDRQLTSDTGVRKWSCLGRDAVAWHWMASNGKAGRAKSELD